MSRFGMTGMGQTVASVGGVSLANLSLNVLDMAMSGGTVTDPDSIMSSAATASDVTTFTFNEVSVGSTDYSFVDGATLNPYRKHWALTDDDGVAVVGGDNVVVLLQIDNSTAFSGDGPTQMFLGIGSTPASTTTATAELAGVIEEHLDAATTPRYRAMAYSGGGGVLSNANNEKGYCAFYLFGNDTPANVDVFAIGSGESYGPSTRAYARTFADAAPLYLVAGCGTRSSGTITANDTAQAILRYRVIRIGS